MLKLTGDEYVAEYLSWIERYASVGRVAGASPAVARFSSHLGGVVNLYGIPQYN